MDNNVTPNKKSDEQLLKEAEITKKQSIKTIYYLNNLLRDCYIKLGRCRTMNVSDRTYDYFYDRLCAMSNFRNETFNTFLIDKANVDRTYEKTLRIYKDILFAEFVKQYPNSGIESVDSLLHITSDVTVMHKEFETELMDLFTRINSGETVKLTPLQQSFMDLSSIVMQVAPNIEYQEIIEGIFATVDRNGRALVKDDCYENNKPMPHAFRVNENTYAISIEKLNNFKYISNILTRKFGRDFADAERKVKILEAKIKTCKNDEKVAVYNQRLSNELSNRNNNQIWLTNSGTIKGIVEGILSRKAGINSKISPRIGELEVALDTISSKIYSGVDNMLLRLITTDKISEVVDYIDWKNEHLVVHNNEIESILEAGKCLYSTIIPTIELAYLTDRYVYLPPEIADYSVEVVKYILTENTYLIQGNVEKLAKVDKMGVQEKLDSLTDEQLENMGYDKEMLKHIVYQTPNGNFVFDGINIYNAVTNELIELEDVDQVYDVFGVKREQSMEETMQSIQQALNDELGNEEIVDENEYNEKVRKVLEGMGYSVRFEDGADDENTPDDDGGME